MNAPGAASSSIHRFPWRWSLAELSEPAEGAPTVFSTFACGGGSTMGYKLAGYRVLGNCEIDPRTAEIYRANLHPELSYVMDIRDFNKLENLPEELFELDVLDGSPPCTPFTMNGTREQSWGKEKHFSEGQKTQRLDDLFFIFLDTVSKLRPKAFIAENVTGLLMKNARGYVNEIIGKARAIGYDVQLFRLNAAFMGVPQARDRLFFIGNRMGWPRLSLRFSETPIPFKDVRSPEGGKDVTPAIKELIPYVKKRDTDFGNAHERKTGKRRYFSYRIAWDDRPGPTLVTSEAVRAFDWRLMSASDLVNVSTFPQDYDFLDADKAFITGMSVPPVMMANIAYEVRRQWLDV